MHARAATKPRQLVTNDPWLAEPHDQAEHHSQNVVRDRSNPHRYRVQFLQQSVQVVAHDSKPLLADPTEIVPAPHFADWTSERAFPALNRLLAESEVTGASNVVTHAAG